MNKYADIKHQINQNYPRKLLLRRILVQLVGKWLDLSFFLSFFSIEILECLYLYTVANFLPATLTKVF